MRKVEKNMNEKEKQSKETKPEEIGKEEFVSIEEDCDGFEEEEK